MTQNIDLTPIFVAYEALVAEADAAFTGIARQYPDCVTCKQGCSDCCNAMFDLSLVESMYLNYRFQAAFDYGPVRSSILEAAADVDRKITRIKREYFRGLRDAGGSEEAMANVLDEASKARVRCPLLGKNEDCALYDFRPITCRLYGVPSIIGGKSRVCSLTRFTQGVDYAAVQVERIQDRLNELSLAVQNTVASRFKELHKVYVPVSMALLTNYDDAYLGIGPAPKEK